MTQTTQNQIETAVKTITRKLGYSGSLVLAVVTNAVAAVLSLPAAAIPFAIVEVLM